MAASSFVVAALAGLAILAGCAVRSNPAEQDQPQPAVINEPGRPQAVTDLSKLSNASTAGLAPSLADQPVAAATPNADRGAARNEALTHQLAARAPSTRYNAVRPKVRGGSRLLNDKARQFANFADLLVGQTLTAAQTLAPEKLGRRRVPAELQPTTLTAVMDAEGRLKEIIIEQHSGDVAVDRLFIEACKQGIWSRNPPAGARAGDGTYRLRVEGLVYNSTYDRYGQYSYDTEVGLGIL